MLNDKLDNIKTHQLETSQLDEIAELLALAFEKGSGLSQICNATGEELHRRLRFIFQSGLALHATAKQQVLTVQKNEQIIGVAVFQEPELHVPLWAQIRWLLQVSFGISPFVAWHLWQSLRVFEQYHPPQPHYYLLLLGVHPYFQGRGYGGALLNALHRRSEAHKSATGVYLETSNPQNVGLYKQFGYSLKGQVDVKGVHTFIMFRPNFVK